MNGFPKAFRITDKDAEEVHEPSYYKLLPDL